jgi:hypothetical protein
MFKFRQKSAFILRGVFFITFKLLKINVLELKGELLDIISKFKKEEQLVRLHQIALEISSEESEEEDWWDDLSDEHRERLEKAIAHSRNPANRIPHEEVKKDMPNG